MILIEEIQREPRDLQGSSEDILDIEWYETVKTIIRQSSRQGRDVAIRKKYRIPLQDGDLLYVGEGFHITVNIKPCDCIIVEPRGMREMGVICFEIGNLHIPIYIDPLHHLCVAYEAPLFNMLQKAGHEPRIEERKLLKVHELRLTNEKTTQY